MPRGIRKRLTFHDWVKSYGVSKLAKEAGICRTTPYKWLSKQKPPGYYLAVILQTIALNHNQHFTIEEIIGRSNE